MSDTLPQTDGTIQLTGLRTDAEVVRDRWGIPHIRAHSTADAFFAQGFVHAQDRMWHMEWDRRRAYGTTAELIGRTGVDNDKLARRLQIERAAKHDWAILNEEARAMVEAYTAGVNAFIARTPVPSAEFEALGIRPAPWRPWDCLSIFKIRHVLMGVLFNKTWRLRFLLKVGAEKAVKLFPHYRDGQMLIIPPDRVYHDGGAVNAIAKMEAAAALLPSAGGSNNWVVDGAKTKSGKPLMAGDPHRAIDVPNVYYQNHITCDAFDVIGVSFPGVPAFPHLGHNDRVAWAITHAQADYQDIYIERFSPKDPALYQFKDEWIRAETSVERIGVLGEADEVITVRRTLHGPGIVDGPWPDYGLSLRYTAFEPGRTFETLLPMLRARTTEELRESQRAWVDPAQNLIIADVDGHIAYHTRGHLPIRPELNGWLPAPGWSGEHEWIGWVPFDAMPRALDPDTHWIATANNKIVDDDYPHYITADLSPGYRYTRIAQMLRPLHDATADDFAAMQADRLSLFAQEFLPHLVAAWDGEPADADVTAALARLRAWDCRMEPDSVAATIYTATRDAMMRLLIEPLIGAEMSDEMFGNSRGAAGHAGRLRTFIPQWIAQNDDRLLDKADPARASWKAVLLFAMRRGVASLRAQLGGDMQTWTWSSVHRTGSVHPLSARPEIGARWNPPSAGYGGDADTVQAGSYYPALGFTVGGTQCYRQIVDVGDWAQSRWVVPLGASGHPDSPHYADQVPVWAANGHVPMWYARADVDANAEARLTLKPGA